MQRSEHLNLLGESLAKAQAVIEGALKDTANPFFKSKYADLSSVWDACRKPLTDNGLSIVQTPTEAVNGIGIETMLLHSSGQWLSNTFVMPVSKADAQGVGGALTYARRYALAAMVGVAPEDDDGNAATKAAPKKAASGSHSSTDGAVESLDAANKGRAMNISKRMDELWKSGEKDQAYDLYHNNGLDSDMRVAVWALLKPFSSMRSELKLMNENKRAV